MVFSIKRETFYREKLREKIFMGERTIDKKNSNEFSFYKKL